jgi:putative ABC transport system ATP-binding protein
MTISEQNDISKQALLVGEALTKTYPMGETTVYALRGVDITLYAGEFIVFLGASGSGKSTLLNIIGGLDTPSSGRLWYREQEITNRNEVFRTKFRRDHIGFVFQFYNLIPSLTARENVALATELTIDTMTPEAALDLVNLGPRLDHFPGQLSGGEQQRVAIARAVAKKPELLLCDEPTGALDFATGKLVLEVLESVNHAMGTTTAIITHNAAIAAMADRVVTMSDGTIQSIVTNERRAHPDELQW